MGAKNVAAIRHRRTFPERLRDIAEYSERVTGYITSLQKANFTHDHETVAAIERCLSIIGDLVDTLSADERNLCSEVALAPFAGLGDRLIHGYRNVDPQKVWAIAYNDVPPLKSTIEHALHARVPDVAAA